MSGLDTYFLEVSAHALLKVGTKASFRGKKSEHLGFLAIFLKRKRRSMTRINCFFITLEGSYLVQIDNFWKSVHIVFCTQYICG